MHARRPFPLTGGIYVAYPPDEFITLESGKRTFPMVPNPDGKWNIIEQILLTPNLSPSILTMFKMTFCNISDRYDGSDCKAVLVTMRAAGRYFTAFLSGTPSGPDPCRAEKIPATVRNR